MMPRAEEATACIADCRVRRIGAGGGAHRAITSGLTVIIDAIKEVGKSFSGMNS